MLKYFDLKEEKHPVSLPSQKSGTGFKLFHHKKEVIGNYIFRLDRIRRNLMVSHAFDPLRLVFKTELNKIRSVSIKKIYRDIKSGQLGNRRLDEFLESMHFRFDFLDGRNSIYLPLFEKGPDKTCNLHMLDGRAKNWYRLISGLLRYRNIRSGWNNSLLNDLVQ